MVRRQWRENLHLHQFCPRSRLGGACRERQRERCTETESKKDSWGENRNRNTTISEDHDAKLSGPVHLGREPDDPDTHHEARGGRDSEREGAGRELVGGGRCMCWWTRSGSAR
jgi:hypothetical protein